MISFRLKAQNQNCNMERKKILTGIISINGADAHIKWEEISFDLQQLSTFQNVLMKQQPGLDPVRATGIILRHRVELMENQGLIFFMEGLNTVGSEIENFKDERMFVDFLREARRYNELAVKYNWQYDKIKTMFLG